MTLTELLAEVYTLTNRPDLTSQTLAAVRSATLRAHRSDYYYRDLLEQTIAFSSSEYLQQIEYESLIPRWRALKYLRKLDASVSPNVPGEFFTIITPEMVLDTYGIQKENVCYVAGAYVQIRSNIQFQYAILGCYINPLVGSTDGTYESWIAISHPWAIIFDAVSIVFRSIGKTSEAQQYMQMAQVEYNELKITNILANGY